MAGSATDSNMPPYGPNDVRMAAARVIARGGNVSVDDEGVCRYVLAQNCHPCALLLEEWLLQSTAFMVAGLSLAWFSVCQFFSFLDPHALGHACTFFLVTACSPDVLTQWITHLQGGGVNCPRYFQRVV